MRFIYTTVKETVSTRGWTESERRGGGVETEMVNGKGKSHVKLYLDHDFCRLANLPLASSSLWAQLL